MVKCLAALYTHIGALEPDQQDSSHLHSLKEVEKVKQKTSFSFQKHEFFIPKFTKNDNGKMHFIRTLTYGQRTKSLA